MIALHLLCQERHGGTFVEQPQLAVGVLLVPRVAVYASIEEGSVEITHQRSYVPAGVKFRQCQHCCTVCCRPDIAEK